MRDADWTSRDGSVRLYLGDCLELLPQLEPGSVDAVVTDPNYGLGDLWQGGTWFTRGVYQGDVSWDAEPSHDGVSLLVGMGLPSIIWGGNYFNLPASRCRLAWQKTNAVPTMADWEEAWTNLDRPSKAFARPRNGWARHHPTEKPLDLIEWCLSFVAGGVLDPFLGSGTTAVACMRTGRKCIGIEIEPKYFAIAVKRCEAEQDRHPLFETKETQRELLP